MDSIIGQLLVLEDRDAKTHYVMQNLPHFASNATFIYVSLLETVSTIFIIHDFKITNVFDARLWAAVIRENLAECRLVLIRPKLKITNF